MYFPRSSVVVVDPIAPLTLINTPSRGEPFSSLTSPEAVPVVFPTPCPNRNGGTNDRKKPRVILRRQIFNPFILDGSKIEIAFAWKVFWHRKYTLSKRHVV